MDQSTKFLLRQRNTLETGYTLENLWAFAQKYALALLLGIFIALVWSNVDDASYQRFCGPAHHGAALANDTNSSAAHRMLLSSSSATGSGSSCPAPKPTILGLSFHGHDVTLNFLVNDVLMTLSKTTSDEIETVEGKEALRQKVLMRIKETMQMKTGKEGIEDIYFTKFVAQ